MILVKNGFGQTKVSGNFHKVVGLLGWCPNFSAPDRFRAYVAL